MPLLLGLLAGASASGQAPATVASIQARYESLKRTVRPAGDLRAQLDAIDRDLAEALRLGRTGEARRLLARALTLINGREWSPGDEFAESLVLRSDAVVIDTSRPYRVRLEQLYEPGLTLTAPPTGRVTLRPLLSQSPMHPERYEVASFDAVPRDLRESPLAMELALTHVPDGPYVLAFDVSSSDGLLGTASLRVWLQKGLAARLDALDTAAARAPESVRGDLRYPVELVRGVNRGRIELARQDIGAIVEHAEALAASVAAGTHPFAGRTGDIARHYRLAAADEILPYRVHVPTSYTGAPLPLVVALHGRGAGEESFIDGYQRALPRLSDERGFFVVAPLGYRVDGAYGAGVDAQTDAETRRVRELSERDVLAVLARVREDYAVDAQRIYLMGHSMGAVGAWHLASKYPQLWAGVAAFAPGAAPRQVSALRGLPQFVVHGTADSAASLASVRATTAEMKRLGIDVTYVEVPKGGHQDVVVPHLGAMMDFFATRRRPAP